MTTLTAYPVLFNDYARNTGRADNLSIEQLFSQFTRQHNVSHDDKAEYITVESRTMRDDYFGPEVVATTPKATKQPSNYRVLQAQCKELGLKANGSTAVLEQRLANPQPGDYAKAKAAPRAKTAKVKEQCFGLSYRQSQRLVSWFRANMPKNYLPLGLKKNIGWDNVKHNAELMMTAHGWAAGLNDRSVQQLVDYCGIIDATQLATFLESTGLG